VTDGHEPFKVKEHISLAPVANQQAEFRPLRPFTPTTLEPAIDSSHEESALVGELRVRKATYLYHILCANSAAVTRDKMGASSLGNHVQPY